MIKFGYIFGASQIKDGTEITSAASVQLYAETEKQTIESDAEEKQNEIIDKKRLEYISSSDSTIKLVDNREK